MIIEILAAIKDFILEKVKSRVFYITLVFLVLFSILVYRLFDLQIKHGEEYQDNFTYTSLKTVSVDSSRGNIYDDAGNLLAYNESSYCVSFAADATLSELAKSQGISENELSNKIVFDTINILESHGDSISVSMPIKCDSTGKLSFTVKGASLNTFLLNVYGKGSVDDLSEEQANATAQDVFDYLSGEKLFDIKKDYTVENALKILSVRYNVWLNRFQQYMSVDIATDISVESYAALEENSSDLPGITVAIESHRIYNDALYFSNIIGYIGNISADEMEELNKDASTDEQYDMSDVVGKAGLEKVLESDLRGTDGVKKMYVDNMGKVIDVVKNTDPVAGNDVYLTINSDLQKYAYQALEQEITSILLAHLANVTSSDDFKVIPITDVYSAMYENNIIDIESMNEENASDIEHLAYNSYLTAKENTLNKLTDILTVSHTSLNYLSPAYQNYMEYICEMLHTNKIYDTGVISDTDSTYVKYINDQISLYEYMKYAISKGAIDISSISTDSDYYDTDEIYSILADYIIKELGEDTTFDKLIFKNMLVSGEITGNQVIHILYDQGILNEKDDEDYLDLQRGVLSNYEFMYKKIKAGEITPAMLALDPCSGSVVITDTRTGEVKAIASYPSYDNNKLTNTIDPDYYEKLTNDKTTPMYNRATLQKTAPGSTFKMVTSVAALEEGVIDIDQTVKCTGYYDKAAKPAKCWIYPSSHGDVNVVKAIEESCNFYFYEMGYRLGTGTNGVFSDNVGVSKIQKYASMFGFDSTSGIELPENEPNMSDTDAVRSAIGQGTHNYTATQLSRYVTTIANKGTCYNLSIVSNIKDVDGNVTYENPHMVYNHLAIEDDVWDAVRQGMRQVVSVHTSSSAIINKINVEVAGKTGTAQQDKTRANHALFVSFAPYEDPEVSVTCVIPNGYSSGNAEELAGIIYAYMYDKDALEDFNATGNNNVSD